MSPTDEAAFTAGFEGFRGSPYLDVAGVPTYGYGSTRDGNGNPVTLHTPAITEAEARVLLARDLARADHTVSLDVHIPLTPTQRTALADFVYNLGAGAFGGSTLLKKLNAGDLTGAAAEFDKWDHAGGREVAGLLRRREAERQAFLA